MQRPHTIAEELIQPVALHVVHIVGESAEKYISKISLPNNTIDRRIYDMTKEINLQLAIEKVKQGI